MCLISKRTVLRIRFQKQKKFSYIISILHYFLLIWYSIFMRKLLLLIFLLSPVLLSAQSLQEWVEVATDIPALQGAWWGGLATYTDAAQDELFSIQADTRFAPASSLKLLTTAAALEKLGPQHRFETKLYTSNLPNTDGSVENLILRGGGDMTLGSKRVKSAQTYPQVLKTWVKAVKEAGIKQVNGTIYADVSLFEGPTIADKVNWENMGNYFAAPASALCLNDNQFAIRFKGETKHGAHTEIAGMEPHIPGVTLHNFVTVDATSKTDNAYVYAAPDQYELKIFGTIPAARGGFVIKGAIPNPALFAAQQLWQALEAEGVSVKNPPQVLTQTPDYSAMHLLHTYQSPTLKEIIVIVNKRSFNLYADMLLRHLALADGKPGSIKNGVAALNQFLREKNIAGENDAVIYDGSGLSRDTMITPRVLVNTLNYMAKSEHFGEYYRSLATPDDRGDLLILRYFLKPKHQIDDVRVKGGTIDGVKTVAGYIHDQDGYLVSFALMANNLATNKDESLWRVHENIIRKLLDAKQTKE